MRGCGHQSPTLDPTFSPIFECHALFSSLLQTDITWASKHAQRRILLSFGSYFRPCMQLSIAGRDNHPASTITNQLRSPAETTTNCWLQSSPTGFNPAQSREKRERGSALHERETQPCTRAYPDADALPLDPGWLASDDSPLWQLEF